MRLATKKTTLETVEPPFEPTPHEFVPQQRNFLLAIPGVEPQINGAVRAGKLMGILMRLIQSRPNGHKVAMS